MEVLAISNNPVTASGSKTRSMSFGSHSVTAYEAAVAKTVAQVDARQKNIRRLYYSVPLLAAFAAAVLHKGNSNVLNKEISGLAGRLAEGVKSGAAWAALLGLGAVIGVGSTAIAKKSEKFRNFRNNHPFLSFVVDMGVFIAALATIPVGIKKLASKINPRHVENLSAGIQNIAGHVNKIKTPNFIKNIGTKVLNALPDAIKDFEAPNYVKGTCDFVKGIGKFLLVNSPSIALLAALFESVSSRTRVTGDFLRNYNEMKQVVNEA